MSGGRIVFLNDNTNRPNELFTLDPKSGAVRQLTHFNDALMAQLDLGKVEPYWFDGAAGDKVHGWLILPPGFDAAKTYPLVQLMHGGPHTMVRDSWSYRWNAHVFAAPGYVVTWVNRHGSTGFGEKFAQSILNEWGEKPLGRHPPQHRPPAGALPEHRSEARGRGRWQLRRLHGGLGRRAHGPLRLPDRPRGRERLHHPVRRGRDAPTVSPRCWAARRGRTPRACRRTTP